MEENEVVESTESGASEGSSPEPSESHDQGAAQAAQQKPDTTPFHEHPRFKELVEQKNTFQKQYQDMESRYKQMESQFKQFQESQPKPQTETDALLKDLKQIDPRLANVIEQQLKAAETANQVKAQLEQFQQMQQEQSRQAVLNSAIGKINSLHESNKMTDFGKQFINNQLDLAYRSGQLNASDLKAVESAYSEAAKVIKSYEDTLKRDLTKSYVADKQKDAAVPASVPKGAQPKQAPKAIPKFQSKDDLRSAVVKSYLKEAQANREGS